MSDIVLGGIIGAGASLITTISTLLIQGYYSKANLKLQIDSQKDQSYIDKLVNLRAKYLQPLSDKVTESYREIEEIKLQILGLFMRDGSHEGIPSYSKEERENTMGYLIEHYKTFNKIMLQSEIIRCKANDKKIQSLFSDLKDIQIKIAEQVNLACGNSIPLLKGKSYNYEMMNMSLSDAEETLRNINERIEQLLSGKE